MNVLPTKIPEVVVVEPRIFADDRGFFYESYNHKVFCEKIGMDVCFVQDNHSCSRHNVLRGLHYQIKQPQDKLVRVIAGKILVFWYSQTQRKCFIRLLLIMLLNTSAVSFGTMSISQSIGILWHLQFFLPKIGLVNL